MSTTVPNDSANVHSSPSAGGGKNAKGTATPQRSAAAAAAQPAPAAAATNSTAVPPPPSSPPPMMMMMPPAAMALPPAVQWLKGRLEAGKKLYPNEDINTERQSEIVVRFVRANIFPFEPDPLEREFRVCDLIHLIGDDTLSDAVCRELYRQLFSPEAPVVPPAVPRPNLRPPSLPPPPHAAAAVAPPLRPVPVAWPQQGRPPPMDGSTRKDEDPNVGLSVEEQASAATIDTTTTQPAASKKPLVRRQHSPKLSPQQWIDLLRGYFAARMEYKIRYGPGAHLSPQTYCVDIGESLRISTLHRKWNESGLDALAQTDLPVDHVNVETCLTAYREKMGQPKQTGRAAIKSPVKATTATAVKTATSTDSTSEVSTKEANEPESSSNVETIVPPPDQGHVHPSCNEGANVEPISSVKGAANESSPKKETATESASDKVAPSKAAGKTPDRQQPKRESKRQRTNV